MDNFLEEAIPIKDWPESQKEILRMYAPEVLKLAEEEEPDKKEETLHLVRQNIYRLQEREKEILEEMRDEDEKKVLEEIKNDPNWNK